jgi:hypothetical protein
MERRRVMHENKIFDEKNIDRVLKKTRRSFNLRILKILICAAAIAWLAYMVPVLLGGVQSLNQVKASRVLMDDIQFSQPDKVNSWGNGAIERGSMTIPFTSSVLPQIGKKFGQQKDFKCGMSLLTGKVSAPVIIGAQFTHPALFKDMLPDRYQSPDAQSAILEKNSGTTVATVNFSLDRLINLTDAANLLDRFDIDICWLAVEAGVENLVPRNMTFQNQQVLQWGIPGKLSKPGEFDYAVLRKDNAADYERAVLDEMEWLDQNKNFLAPDKLLLRDNGIDSSVKGKASYVLQNGIKIYGLQVTGPSSELLKLKNDLHPRLMMVVDMDFWNW